MKLDFNKFAGSKKFAVFFYLILISATLASRICAAHYLANDEPDDGKMYAQIARNLLEQGVYSIETEAPFTPTLIRLPGYPIFLAGVYAVFGHDNNAAARIVQAVFDTATCLLVALIAWNWTEDKERKRRAALWAFLTAALCPFTAIYVAMILTETLTTFLMTAMTLTATYALKARSARAAFGWWLFAGLIAGEAVLLRPDSGLFAAGIGFTLVISGLFWQNEPPPFKARIATAFWRGAVFSAAFALVLVPWAIRNEQVFHLFQPLAPAHGEMPGEFVPQGFNAWVRTWIDDQRFVGPTLWDLEEKPITVDQLPASAFDSDEEKERVAALLNQYNHPLQDETKINSQANSSDLNKPEKTGQSTADSNDVENVNGDDNNDDAEGGEADDADDQADDSSDNDNEDENNPPVKMTTEIDAGFEQIAVERINRAPVRYYVWLPVKRAAALWFDTHSAYYPFAGELFPLNKLDREEHQEIWLPIFVAAMWLYTLLAAAGACVLWFKRKTGLALSWLLLAALMSLPRVAFFASLENPEPRYVVELFAFASILGGIAIAQLNFKKKRDEGKQPV